MYSDKIQKYQKKMELVDNNNIDKKNLYQRKLDYYNGLHEPVCQKDKSKQKNEMTNNNFDYNKLTDDINLLLKPIIYSQEKYELNIDTPDAIKAVGYGTLHKDFPLVKMIFDRRTPKDNDVVIEILYCGVCHSDWHVIKNEWKNSKYPVIVGHEITGQVLKVGKNVTKFKVGDYVAVGPNYNSCRRCCQCDNGFEQYCLNDTTEVYNMPDRRDGELKPTGPITYGGYSNIIVVNEYYVLSLPEGTKLDKIAPVLCAGATMYTPLKYMNIKKGSRVGIAGIGGLGHIGIKLAKALGAEVVAITRTPDKLSDAKRLGSDESLLVTDMDSLKPYHNWFDLIIDTIPFNHDLMPYIDLIAPQGTLWIIGSFFSMATDFNLVNRSGRIIRGSSIAGIADTQEIINLCVENNIYPEIIPIKIQDLNNTHHNIINSKVRYRYVVDMSTIYQ
ncbi:alcohol dehydrogenase [Tupanvirus soda lake]|uniref:Alcohol dehydrogenase n=2 Tax=Tupanvirus TaxID=2094720 RepID=A0A6N1NMG8_9VIRU|nr:alcohol dehydrogenase [Tupanvirus soda lake]QKU35619.1 alcohol dehydrogenase [Tupanvirus soda lake]